MSFLPSALLIAALSAVESGDNQYAVAHDRQGKVHYGILQIGEAVVLDANDFLREKNRKGNGKSKKYWHRDCLKREPSIEIFKLYCERYLRNDASDRDVCMLWHYGPTGMNRKAASAEAAEYWMRVSATMEALKQPVPFRATD